jgi:hypothetical protein
MNGNTKCFLAARSRLMSVRTVLAAEIRHILKSSEIDLPSCGPSTLVTEVERHMPSNCNLRKVLDGLLETWKTVSVELDKIDDYIADADESGLMLSRTFASSYATLGPTAAPIPFVIASTPRSGTAYITRILNELSIGCVHEQYFERYQQVYFVDDNRGCSSWLSVPFLHLLPKETKILHQVRDPVSTINSLIDTHNYRNCVGRNMPFLRSKFSATTDQPEAEFWYDWHLRIDKYAHFRYRLEDLPLDDILEYLEVSRSRSEVDKAIRLVTTSFNSYGPVKAHMQWCDLPENVKCLAVEYGYGKGGVC